HELLADSRSDGKTGEDELLASCDRKKVQEDGRFGVTGEVCRDGEERGAAHYKHDPGDEHKRRYSAQADHGWPEVAVLSGENRGDCQEPECGGRAQVNRNARQLFQLYTRECTQLNDCEDGKRHSEKNSECASGQGQRRGGEPEYDRDDSRGDPG